MSGTRTSRRVAPHLEFRVSTTSTPQSNASLAKQDGFQQDLDLAQHLAFSRQLLTENMTSGAPSLRSQPAEICPVPTR